jgi:transposase
VGRGGRPHLDRAGGHRPPPSGRPGPPADPTGHPRPSGRKRDPLYRIRRLLLTAQEQLTERGRVRLRAGLAAGDPTGKVAAAWQGKELLRAVYAAVGTVAACAALDGFYHWADGVEVPELSRLARMVRVWEAEILAWHATGGCSNGPTEAVNLLIKKVKHVGHGFRNFANYRLRLLLHCGVTWQIHQTAGLRDHSPRLLRAW